MSDRALYRRVARALALATLLVASTVDAEPASDALLARATELVAQGQALFSSKQYAEAAALFAEADRIVPSAVVKQNEAASWERAGRADAAADAYEAALAMGTLDAEYTADSKKRLAALEQQLAVIVVAEPKSGTLVAGDRTRTIPVRLHFFPGAHSIEIRSATGRRITRRVELSIGQVEHLALPADPPPQPPPSPPPPRETRPAPPSEGGGAARPVGFAFLGVGVAAGIAAVVCSVQYLRVRDDLSNDTGNDSLRDEATAWQTASTATGYPAIGLTAIGVALLVLSAKSGTRAVPTRLVPPRAMLIW